jgi:hypothetical protein
MKLKTSTNVTQSFVCAFQFHISKTIWIFKKNMPHSLFSTQDVDSGAGRGDHGSSASGQVLHGKRGQTQASYKH